jgi:membrane protease YdiL (CAAX protease family)
VTVKTLTHPESMPITPNYFLKQASFRFKRSSVFIFIVASVVAWEINVFGQILFPSQNLFPFVIRTIVTLITDFAFLMISVRLLKQNHLSAEALGLHPSRQSILYVLIGAAIGVITFTTIGALLYSTMPFHFIGGPLNGIDVLKTSLSYLSGNALEELLFRGFILILLSQLLDWRLGILILALPFGLFHLQGTGLSSTGFGIVASTTTYALVFGLSFVLTRSLWTAITAHVILNILLHLITGLDGIGHSVYAPVFEKSWPKNYNCGLWVMIGSAILFHFCFIWLLYHVMGEHRQIPFIPSQINEELTIAVARVSGVSLAEYKMSFSIEARCRRFECLPYNVRCSRQAIY